MTHTDTKTYRRVTWNETTFDADVLHLAMLDHIAVLRQRITNANSEIDRLTARRDALLVACEYVLAIAEARQGGTWDDVMLAMRAATRQARAGEEG